MPASSSGSSISICGSPYDREREDPGTPLLAEPAPRSLMDTQTLLYSSATAIARAIRDRRVSSEEVVAAHLERILALNPLLNSVIQIAPESALEQARAADEAIVHGRPLGPLHGVPFTVKDVYEIKESARLVTAPGMAERLGTVAERDSTV